MICNLNPLSFRSYGTILSADALPAGEETRQISLYTDRAMIYEAASEVVLNKRSGMCILTVTVDGVHFEDFYLDKPVRLQAGIRFALTGLQEGVQVLLSATQAPSDLGTEPATDRFFVQPKMRMDALCTLFYQEKEPGFFFGGESHPMLELTYVDQGSLHSVVDGKDLLLEQGELMLYGPHQWHMQYADGGVAPRFVTISFMLSGQPLEALFNRKHRPSQQVVTLLQRILQEWDNKDEYREDVILSMLRMVLVLLLRSNQEPEQKLALSNSLNNENHIISMAQQFIVQQVQQKLSVPLVAKSVDVSTSYLTALFHKHLRISPGEYIRRIKLQKSKQMIREGNLNFTEIAQTLQYSTVHHFSRQFKEKFGMTPTEFARSVR